MLLSCLSRSTSLPSAIIARCGYVWLPIGRPSGFAGAAPPPAGMNPAAVAPAAVFPKNSRLVIASIVTSPDCQLNCEISTAPSAFRLKPEDHFLGAAGDAAALLVNVNVPKMV